MSFGNFPDRANLDQFTQESSSIIPSSDSELPPPIVCFVPNQKPVEGNDPGEAADGEVTIFSEAESDPTTRQRTFTQADDFNDIAKEGENVMHEASSSEDSSGRSIYRLKSLSGPDSKLCDVPSDLKQMNMEDDPLRRSDAAIDGGSSQPFLSPSDFPLMSQTERVGLGWIKECSFACSQPRGSTPVHLTFMTDGNRPPFRQPYGSSSADPSGCRKWSRSSEPVGSSRRDGSATVEGDHSDEPFAEEESARDSTAFSSVGHSSSQSKVDSPLTTEASISGHAGVTDPPVVDQTDAATSTCSSNLTGYLVKHELSYRRISVHISMMSSSMDSSFSINEPILHDGYTIDVGNFSSKWLLDRLADESYRLFTRIENALGSLLCSSGREQVQAAKSFQKSSGPTTSCEVALQSKPIICSDSRTSSSSSDLFIPRAERLHVKRKLGQLSNRDRVASILDGRFKQFRAHCIPICTTSSSSAHDSSSSSRKPSSSNSAVFVSPTPLPGPMTKDPLDKIPVPVSSVESHMLSPAGSNESPQILNYQPSLALVLETPSEDTESARQPSPSAADGEAKLECENEPVKTEDTISEPCLAIEKRVSPGSVHSCEATFTSGRIPVYGKWCSEPYYYAGTIELPQTGSRWLVHFDDGSKANLKPADILFVDLLPVNCEICADWSNTGEYWSDCVIEAHLMDSRRPYQVFCRINNERRALCRKDVAIHQSHVRNLRGMISSPQLSDSNPTPHTSVLGDKTLEPSNTDLPVKKLTTSRADVSLENIVFSKRKAKVKRSRSSWLTPLTRLAAEETKTDPASVSTCGVQRHSSRLLCTPTNSRSLTYRSARRVKRSHPVSVRTPTTNIVEWKRQRLGCVSEQGAIRASRSSPSLNDKRDNTRILTHDRSVCNLNTETHYSSLPPDCSTSVFIRRSLSGLLDIPIRRPDIFSNWTVVFTGLTNPPGQPDRDALKQLVLACGGRVSEQLTAGMLPNPAMNEKAGCLAIQNHRVALVSSGCCRTLRYFQALATLGRVPLLHSDWLLDACREEAASSNDENVKPDTKADWPLRILLSRPGRYELHRGYISGEEVPVSWLSVPPMYCSPAYQSLPAPSIFALQSGWTLDKYELVAIVTDDVEIFGPAWSNILHLANGASLYANSVSVGTTKLKPVPIFSYSEAPKRLNQILVTGHRSGQRGSAESKEAHCALVLVDVTELPVRTVTALESLACQLVTNDYFMQSLICGRLLNPRDSPSFVPPVH